MLIRGKRKKVIGFQFVVCMGSRRKMPQEQLQDYTYAASGSFGLIICWIMTDCKEEPQKLADRITELTRSVRIMDDSK